MKPQAITKYKKNTYLLLIYFVNNYPFSTIFLHSLYKIVYIDFNSQSYVFLANGQDDAQGYEPIRED